MGIQARACIVLLLLALPFTGLLAADYKEAINVFKQAGESGDFFKGQLRLRRVSHRRQGRCRHRRGPMARAGFFRAASTSATPG